MFIHVGFITSKGTEAKCLGIPLGLWLGPPDLRHGTIVQPTIISPLTIAHLIPNVGLMKITCFEKSHID